MTVTGIFRAIVATVRAAFGFRPNVPGPTKPGDAQRAYWRQKQTESRQRRRQQQKRTPQGVNDMSLTVSKPVNDTPQEEEEKKKKKNGTLLPDDWPNEEGRRFAREQIGYELTQIEIVVQRKYWAGQYRDDWDLVWFRRIRAVRQPMLALPPTSRQLNAVKTGGTHGRRTSTAAEKSPREIFAEIAAERESKTS